MNPQDLPSHWHVTPNGQLVISRTVAPNLIQLAWGCMATSVIAMVLIGLQVSFFSTVFWFCLWAPVFLAGLFLVKTNGRAIVANVKSGYLELFSEYGFPLLFRLSEITGIVPVYWEAGNAPLRVTFCSVAIQVQDGSLLRLPFITTDRACSEAWAEHLASFTGCTLQPRLRVVVPQLPELDKLSSLSKVGN